VKVHIYELILMEGIATWVKTQELSDGDPVSSSFLG
jgi:hypothetical protein